jgi:putative RNA 2'-phosphotransferase
MASEIDPIRVSKTMAFLLRHRPEVGDLNLDPAGWVALDDLVSAVSRLLHHEVEVTRVRMLVVEAHVRRFEIVEGRIRALDRSGGHPRAAPPDIVYHACTHQQERVYREQGYVSTGGNRPIYLSNNEPQAWRAAHRMGASPRVLYIDTARSRRHGIRFYRNRRNGLYLANRIGVDDVLNLKDNYAEQISAGGIPLVRGDDGVPRMALIRVTRRSGITWEVAKGKLEPGETPEKAAVREVREEMGLVVDLRITQFVEHIRYGFLAPGGLPRLKTVYLYLMEPTSEITTAFRPSVREGIGDVRWFTPNEACKAVSHSSLIPAINRARQILNARY